MAIHILFKNDKPVHLTTKSPWTGTPKLAEITDADGNNVDYDSAKSNHEWKTFEEVDTIAKWATEKYSKEFLGIDDGEWCWPRYGIIEAPAVGDDVSRGMNSDYYYVGKVDGHC